MRHAAIIALLSLAAPAHASGATSGSAQIRLNVGPGVTAGGRLQDGSFKCGDAAKCVFATGRGSTMEIQASGPAGRSLRWTGCTYQRAPSLCTVKISGDTAVVTVN